MSAAWDGCCRSGEQSGGAAVVLRSQSPPLIRQEIYAMLCCYQAIRTLISHAANTAGLDPDRISFTHVCDAVRGRISDPGCFSPPELDDLLTDLAFEITLGRNLVPRRPCRRYKRETSGVLQRYAGPKRVAHDSLYPLDAIAEKSPSQRGFCIIDATPLKLRFRDLRSASAQLDPGFTDKVGAMVGAKAWHDCVAVAGLAK